MDAQRTRWGVAPFEARNSQRSPENASRKCWYASFAFAIASLPRSARAPSVPIASSRLSASVSTRETKKLATEATLDGSFPAATSRSSPRRYASTTSLYRWSEKISVMLMFLPAAIMSSIAPSPGFVAGIFTKRFGRSTRPCSRWASS